MLQTHCAVHLYQPRTPSLHTHTHTLTHTQHVNVTHTHTHTHRACMHVHHLVSYQNTVIKFSEKCSTHTHTYTQSWLVNIQNSNPLKTPFSVTPSLPLSISLSPPLSPPPHLPPPTHCALTPLSHPSFPHTSLHISKQIHTLNL